MKNNLIAVHTKSNGWIEAVHEYENGKFLIFGLNNDKTINVYKKELNPNVNGFFFVFINIQLSDERCNRLYI